MFMHRDLKNRGEILIQKILSQLLDSGDLDVPRHNTSCMKRSTAYRAAKARNSLPLDIRDTKNKLSFTIRVKKNSDSILIEELEF